MDLLFELNVAAAPKGSREIANTLYRQLRSGIIDGRLKRGAQLPSTRNARRIFGVSRNTAQEVYERLAHEGLVVARHGSGTYVSDPLPNLDRPAPHEPIDRPDSRLNDFWLRPDVASDIGFWREPRDMLPTDIEGADLRPAIIDPRLFPFATFRQIMVKQLRRLETRPPAFKSPQWNQGNYPLRRGISEHVALTRAVACQPEDILVTSGAQQAFDLIARTLVRPGETVVAIEDPGYPPMRVPFLAAGGRIVPVRVDDEGLVVDDLPPDARIICVCPSHQFPLGMSMSPSRRKKLIDFASRTGAIIVEDDYDGEFRYEGSPLEALRTEASSDTVFYVGSFSKCMLPSLRLGYLVAPRWAMRTLIAAKNSIDWHCSVPMQMAVAAFISDGHLARHVRRMRRTYQARREYLLAALQEKAGDLLQPIPSFYGMHVTATARGEYDCEAISEHLAGRGFRIHALDRYYLGQPARSGFVLGYAAADRAALASAVTALAAELKS